MSTNTPPQNGFTVKLPDFSTGTICRVARGYSMGAIRDGWLIVHEPATAVPATIDPDMLYCLETIDGRQLIRFLRKGRNAGTYDLLAVTGEPILDCELRWATPVTYIVPHRLTDEQVEHLQAIKDVTI